MGLQVTDKYYEHVPERVINVSGSSIIWGTAVAQWLRYCATNRKVTGSIPDGDWIFPLA
jgi:hypothetical protein